MCIERSHPKISVRRQCRLLSLTRSNLYYRPKGERAENLCFMTIIRCPAGACVACCREGQTVPGNTMVRVASVGAPHATSGS